MHDFNNRPKYHVILEFLEIVDTIDLMAEFRVKKGVDSNLILAIWEKYKLDFD